MCVQPRETQRVGQARQAAEKHKLGQYLCSNCQSLQRQQRTILNKAETIEKARKPQQNYRFPGVLFVKFVKLGIRFSQISQISQMKCIKTDGDA